MQLPSTKAYVFPFEQSKHDPYDECCAGSHTGERVLITSDRNWGFIVELEEVRSGIGDSVNVCVHRNGKRIKIGCIFDSDDGDGLFWAPEGADPDDYIKLEEQDVK